LTCASGHLHGTIGPGISPDLLTLKLSARSRAFSLKPIGWFGARLRATAGKDFHLALKIN